MEVSVEVTSAMRFAAAERQWLLESAVGRGLADLTDWLEVRALRAARFAESFPGSYSAELVAASRALLGLFTFGADADGWAALYASDDYYQHCQMVLGLAEVTA